MGVASTFSVEASAFAGSLDLLRLPLIVGLEMLDLSLFLSDQFLEPNYL
jgi:hypothetical protein